MAKLKDERLAALARHHNVARFLSFGPGNAELRHSVGVREIDSGDLEEIIARLLSPNKTVNVRTFLDDNSKSTDFVYGIPTAADAAAAVRRYANQGLYTIVNETIDVGDGGVSGVSMAHVTEFAPGGTPRLVEDSDRLVARLPTPMAWEMLRIVYGLDRLHAPKDSDRVEFSVHPLRVGHRSEHVLVWEVGPANETHIPVRPSWPNDFSKHIGDKAYGLLVGHLAHLPVPFTTVIARNVAPFHFGQTTGSSETWLRTAPMVAEPGYFTTTRGWLDPFELLAKEDPDNRVASVIAQEGVPAQFSGGAVSRDDNQPLIEGVARYGIDFMSGTSTVETLPSSVTRQVEKLVRAAEKAIGQVQIEWVYDGTRAWLVQLHVRMTGSLRPERLSSGEPHEWLPFDPSDGLEKLRLLVDEASKKHFGVEVLKPVGVTSHVGDILRKAGVPGRLATGPHLR